MQNQSQKITKILSEVMDPELGLNIVDLGMVKNITIGDNLVNIELALTTISCPLRSQIQKNVTSKIVEEMPDARVSFSVVEMDPGSKSRAMALARTNASKSAAPNSIPSNAKILAIASGKGGVGKSTVTAQLAYAIAAKGHTVGILDADIWGFSIPKLLGMAEKIQAVGTSDSWKITPVTLNAGAGELRIVSMGFLAQDPRTAIMWRGLVLNRAFQHFIEDVDWSNIDYLLIDMPPGTGDIQMGLSRMLPNAQVLIVTTPNDSATQVALRMVDMSNKGNLEVIGLVENMSYFVCNHGENYNIFGMGSADQMANDAQLEVLARIPIANRSLEQNMTIADKFNINHLTPEITQTIELADRIIQEISPIIEMEGCTSRILEIMAKLEKEINQTN